MSPTPPLLTIAVIGAGFSGALTAINLLRLAHGRPVRVVLLNRSGRMARGVAYGTSSAEHLLNVPAGNMSAMADDPDDFLRYCRWADPSVTPASFVRRAQYGAYLEALVEAAEFGAPRHASLERWVGEAVDLEAPAPGRPGAVYLADGRRIDADHVVLAFGHFAPADPAALPERLRTSARYVRDPWAAGALGGIGGDEPVLLLGSGLTALDVVLALAARGHRGPVTLVSRRGLLPAAHREQRGRYDEAAALALAGEMAAGARGGLKALRRAMRLHEAQGGDWRDVMAAVRPHLPALWQRLPPWERRRFVQRLQPYWDAARHRCAPLSHARFEALRAEGRVRLRPGRLLAVHERRDGLEVELQPRDGGASLRLTTAHIVNCTGPTADLTRGGGPLVGRLLARGWLQPDELGLGVAVDEQGALVDRQGRASAWLHYVGPLLRARDWEATAVPELRVHARRLAERLLAGPTAR